MKYITIILAFILSSSFLSGETHPFNQALNTLVTNCPQIEILRQNNIADIAVERASNRLNSPEVELEHVWGRDGVGNKFDLSVSQSFDWPTLYRVRAKAINAQANANLLLEQATVIEKINEVQSIMVDIVFQKKNLALDNMIYSHMLEMEESSKEAYQRGEISKLEYMRTQLERIQISIQLRENERILNELFTSLEAATGNQQSRAVMEMVEEVPEWTIHTEEEYENQMNTLNPRMAYLKAMQDATVATAKAQRISNALPSFNVGYVFQREQGETFNGFNISFTLPIYGNSNMNRASKANVLSMQLEAQLEEITMLSRVRNQRKAALSLAKELNDYSAIFDKDNYSDMLKLALEGGQTDNVHYLQELNYYIEVTRQYIELQHQYNLALVSLNRYDIFN